MSITCGVMKTSSEERKRIEIPKRSIKLDHHYKLEDTIWLNPFPNATALPTPHPVADPTIPSWEANPASSRRVGVWFVRGLDQKHKPEAIDGLQTLRYRFERREEAACQDTGSDVGRGRFLRVKAGARVGVVWQLRGGGKVSL